MPTLADLWDEDKYSEGDPVRQLIAFSKSIPDWPKDVLNFGNESIDSLTSMIPNKGLHTNLRGKLYDPMYNGETSVSATPGEDVQNAKHLAKAMNPLLWAGGQELNTFGLRKKITEALHNKYNMEINPSRRGFLVGKATADVVHPLEAPLDEILQTPMTRRTVNKGLAAGAAGVAMGGGLLSKFAKIPETVKALETVAPIAEQATKYKYNTLGEYLAHTKSKATLQEYNDIADLPKKLLGNGNIAKMDEKEIRKAREYIQMRRDNREEFINDLHSDILKQDEAAYKESKNLVGQIRFNESGDPITMFDSSMKKQLTSEEFSRILDHQNEFSPQAKEEMKDYKSKVNSIFPNVEGKPNIDWHDSSLMQSYLDDIKNIGEVQW